MTQSSVDRIVKQIEDIPTLPIVSNQIQSLFRDDEASIKEIESIIQKDPPLATKLLKMVNSSFYGLLNKVSTIDHALVILGFKEVKNVVLGFSIQNHFNQSNNTFDRKRFWKHSVICSQLAKHLGKHFSIVDDGTFLLSGLIHDIGKLVIDQYFPDEFQSIVEYISQNNCTFSQAEKEILGVTHYQVAAKLLQQWHFPKKVVMQIFYHHAPWHDKNYTAGSIIIYLANILAKLSGYSCLEEEQEVRIADFLDSSALAYVNKSGFDLDHDSFEMLRLQINEFLAAESNNILNMFE
ncbi:HDOD domain-containing protein [Thermodesulfobacteriota bacterium]